MIACEFQWLQMSAWTFNENNVIVLAIWASSYNKHEHMHPEAQWIMNTSYAKPIWEGTID